MTVRVQEADFDTGAELDRLTNGNRRIGGLAVFVGLVREMHVREGLHRDRIDALTLEHYPGMAEAEINRIAEEAAGRWPVAGITIVHRHGKIRPGENIVLVATASVHREAAFEAARFLMDFLKTRAPFWKKEHLATAEGGWVAARDADEETLARWGKKG